MHWCECKPFLRCNDPFQIPRFRVTRVLRRARSHETSYTKIYCVMYEQCCCFGFAFVYLFKCMTNLVFGLFRYHALGIKSRCCHKVCLPLSFVFCVLRLTSEWGFLYQIPSFDWDATSIVTTNGPNILTDCRTVILCLCCVLCIVCSVSRSKGNHASDAMRTERFAEHTSAVVDQ